MIRGMTCFAAFMLSSTLAACGPELCDDTTEFCVPDGDVCEDASIICGFDLTEGRPCTGVDRDVAECIVAVDSCEAEDTDLCE